MSTATGIKKRNGLKDDKSGPGLRLVSQTEARTPKRKGFTIGLCEHLSSVNKNSFVKPKRVEQSKSDAVDEPETLPNKESRHLSRRVVTAAAIAGVAGLVFGLLVGRRVDK